MHYLTMVGGWWRLVAGGGWLLAVGGGGWWAVGGGRLVVPRGCPYGLS